MTTWPAPQAEAWMRANPGRWLERVDKPEIATHVEVTGGFVEMVGTMPHYSRNLDPESQWHPPREHYAAEREAMTKACGALVRLWRTDAEWLGRKTCGSDHLQAKAESRALCANELEGTLQHFTQKGAKCEPV